MVFATHSYILFCFLKEAAELKEKLQKCEADIESSRKSNELNLVQSNELNLVPLSNFSSETYAIYLVVFLLVVLLFFLKDGMS